MDFGKMRPWAKIITAFATVYILSLVASFYLLDPDFGWHLQAGNYIIKHGIPAYDVFSYTASDFPWINHEWLYDIFIALLFSLGGFTLIALVSSFIWTLAITLASRTYNIIAMALAYISILSFSTARPSAWSLLFFVLTERIAESKRFAVHALFPFLILLWANMHGSFVIGLGVMTLFRIIKKTTMSWFLIVASYIATLINPYGIKLYSEIARTVFDYKLHARIVEWHSFYIPKYFLVPIIILLAAFLALGPKLKMRDRILPAIILLGSLSSARYFLFFPVAILRYSEQTFNEIQEVIKKKLDKLPYMYLSIGVPFIIVSMSIGNFANSPMRFPIKSVEELTINSCEGNIFNHYDFGGYLIWKVPNQKVFIDGRMPSWKLNDIDYMKVYLDSFSSSTVRKATFDKYNIRCVLVKPNKNTVLINDLKNENWKVITEEKEAILLKK